MAALACSSCSGGSSSTPDDRVCDGIQASIGGCDANQPTFVGTTCEAIATELGDQAVQRLQAIVAGPDIVNGYGRSGRVQLLQSLITVRARQQLERQGLAAPGKCDPAAFLNLVVSRLPASL
jgi:hypothetical protein